MLTLKYYGLMKTNKIHRVLKAELVLPFVFQTVLCSVQASCRRKLRHQQSNALSLVMKEVLSTCQLLKVVGQGIGLHERSSTAFKTTVGRQLWEDNFG